MADSVSRPWLRNYSQTLLTGEEPSTTEESEAGEFVLATRGIHKIPSHYLELMSALGISSVDYQLEINGFHCHKHGEVKRRPCDIKRLYLPLVTAGKYHPYQSFKHRCRASSQALDRLEFLEKECHKRRVKFDYVIKIDLTLPKQVSELWDSKKTQFCINRAVRDFLRLLHKELFPRHQSQFGVIANHHFWATKTPLEPHRHVHLTLPNVTYNPLSGMFYRFRPWIAEKVIKKCWRQALKKNGLWVDVPDHVKPDTFIGYIKFAERGKVLNRISYTSRKPTEDMVEFLSEEQLSDFDKEFAKFLLDYTPRRVNLGFLSNLKKFGYSHKRNSIRCPVCGDKMELERDENGKPIVYDRPPPGAKCLILERTGKVTRFPNQGNIDEPTE